MSAAKHTPGPWEVTHTGNKDDFRGLRTWITAPGGTVAAVFPCGNPRLAFRDAELSDLPEPSNGPIGQANARLIANVTELLEMLQGVLKAARDTEGRIVIYGWQEEVLRATVAKATGTAIQAPGATPGAVE